MRDYQLKLYRGKWAVYYRDGGQTRRHSCGTSHRALAEKIKVRIVQELEKPEDHKIKTLWDAYVKAHKGRTLADNMKYAWPALEKEFGDGLETEAITVEKCRKHITRRRAEGRKDGTIWSELNRLRIVMNWAKKNKLIHDVPPFELPQQPESKDRFLTRREFSALLENAVAPHIKVAIALLMATGARKQAILDLTWDRVDMERGIIVLRNPFEQKRQKGRATVPINRSLMAVLQTARDASTCEFVVEYGSKKVGDIKKGFAKAAERAGLAEVTPHVLRHTAAVWMAEDGIQMEEIAQFLGHKNVNTTRRIYARYSPDYLRTASEALVF